MAKIKIRRAIGRAVRPTQAIGRQFGTIALQCAVALLKTGSAPRITQVVSETAIIEGKCLTLDARLYPEGFGIGDIAVSAAARGVDANGAPER